MVWRVSCNKCHNVGLISLSNGQRWGRNSMLNFHLILRPFAGVLSAFAMCVSAGAQDCPDLNDVHGLLPQIDNQIAGPDKLAYNNGPLKPGKSGYGFALREDLFLGLTCKANPLFRDRKIVLNCAVSTPSKAKAEACLLYTSPSPRDKRQSRMPSSA